MINIHSALYYLLLEALAVFILLTAVLSFFQVKRYLDRKKTLVNIVNKLKKNGSQRKEELIRLLKEQGEMDEEQLSMISNEIIKNETLFYQYIIHALVKVDLNQISDLDKHVEVLINSVSKTNLAKKTEASDGLEQFATDLSELRTTVQEVREGQCQLMTVMTQAPIVSSTNTIENSDPSQQTAGSEAIEAVEAIKDVSDDFTASETVNNIETKSETSPKENSADISVEPLLEIKESTTDEVDPDDIIDNMLAQPDLPTKNPVVSDEDKVTTKQNEPPSTSLIIEDDIDAILDEEINSTTTNLEKSTEIDIDALIENVADENKSTLIGKNVAKVNKQTPESEADDILGELSNIETLQTEKPTHQDMESNTDLAEDLEELLK